VGEDARSSQIEVKVPLQLVGSVVSVFNVRLIALHGKSRRDRLPCLRGRTRVALRRHDRGVAEHVPNDADVHEAGHAVTSFALVGVKFMHMSCCENNGTSRPSITLQFTPGRSVVVILGGTR
jgi:hypothetical protein